MCAGYFIGSACLAFNYYFALGFLLFLILLAYPWAAVGLSPQLGRTRKENATLASVFKQAHNVNMLSAARMFLFGARDLWFEVRLLLGRPGWEGSCLLWHSSGAVCVVVNAQIKALLQQLPIVFASFNSQQ